MVISANKNEDTLVTKNHKIIDYNTIKNITIKDIGWEAVFDVVSNLFIVDTKANVYRIRGIVADMNITCYSIYNYNIYDYTAYKQDKEKHIRKKEMRKAKIKSLFVREKYQVI